MNVGDWVEIDTGWLKGSLARITHVNGSFFSVVTTEGHTASYLGEDSFKRTICLAEEDL